LTAAVAAGAQLDTMYHPGVWRSPEYSCCHSLNKRAPGCQPTNYHAPVTMTFNSRDAAGTVTFNRWDAPVTTTFNSQDDPFPATFSSQDASFAATFNSRDREAPPNTTFSTRQSPSHTPSPLSPVPLLPPRKCMCFFCTLILRPLRYLLIYLLTLTVSFQIDLLTSEFHQESDLLRETRGRVHNAVVTNTSKLKSSYNDVVSESLCITTS